MQDDINVKVAKYSDRKHYHMYYVDPHSAKKKTKSTGETDQKKAEKKAAVWENELRSGRYQEPSKISWDDFREQHEKHVLSAKREETAKTYRCTLNVFETELSPQRIADITTAKVTAFTTAIRNRGIAVETIHHHLRHLKAVLRWANRQGYLAVMPTIEMPKRSKGMKGRAITAEEFERMLAATGKAVGVKAAASFKFYLRGLWASGLRLSESLLLSWTERPGAIVVELNGRYPMLRIPAEAEKGNSNRLLPMAPEFAKLLLAVPEAERKGWVFNPLTKTGEPAARNRYSIGPRVTAIGKKAGVVKGERIKEGETIKAFAGAHEFRRAFGTRWAKRVMPAELRELMRHSSVATTMQYYVDLDAQDLAGRLWDAAGEGLATDLATSATAAELPLRKTLK